jgi:hypothetical protein
MELKNSLTVIDTVAGILLTTTVEEYNKKKLELPVIDNDTTYIKETITEDKVKYSLIGSLGDKINNPDIILEFTDVFSKDSKPSISELNDTFIKLYVTLYLLSKSKDE